MGNKKKAVSGSILYPVKVLKPNGKLKKVIQVSKLKKVHWEKFDKQTQINRTGESFVMFNDPKNPLSNSYNPKYSKGSKLAGISEINTALPGAFDVINE